MGESNFLDIRSFVYPKDRLALLKVNPKSKYVSDENFYAILDFPNWQYERTTLEEFVHSETGDEMPPTLKKMSGKTPVHTWKAAQFLAVKGPHDYSESGPEIMIEKLPYASTVPPSKEDFSKFAKEVMGAELKPDEAPDLAYFERLFRGDMATVQLAGFMQSNLEQFVDSTGIDTRLVELEKVGNVLYLQILVTIHDATVNGKKLPIFFVRNEEIIITDKNAMTLIIITVPSADPAPRGPAYAQIQEWFSGLAIPVG